MRVYIQIGKQYMYVDLKPIALKRSHVNKSVTVQYLFTGHDCKVIACEFPAQWGSCTIPSRTTVEWVLFIGLSGFESYFS